MKVPLIASINHRTIDLKNKTLKVKMFRNGKPEAVESPYSPYYYIESPEGEEKRLVASDKTIKVTN